MALAMLTRDVLTRLVIGCLTVFILSGDDVNSAKSASALTSVNYINH
ncbi:MAG: hypothetical protein HRU22_11190 [Gammaproteobacteria bacterium]|nr:hypothetical protein [Gammaproteobacteria bacterium]